MPNVNAGQRVVVGSGSVPYARILMSTYLNRVLDKNEVVHHKDEDPSNNSLDNLQVMSRSEHTRLHKMGNTYKRGTTSSEEQRRKSSLSHMGQVASPEKLERMRQANLGKTLSAETRSKISLSLQGHECSKETRDKIAGGLKRSREIDKMTWSDEVLEEAMKGFENV
jgi:hypothetical protein